MFDFTKARFNEEWLLSIYLSGFYDCFSKDDDSKAIDHLQHLAEKAKWQAKSGIELILKKHAGKVIESIQQSTVNQAFPMPSKPHPVYVARLLDLAKHQRASNANRHQLFSEISSVPGLTEHPRIARVMVSTDG